MIIKVCYRDCFVPRNDELWFCKFLQKALSSLRGTKQSQLFLLNYLHNKLYPAFKIYTPY